jgi:hypothetical protein
VTQPGTRNADLIDPPVLPNGHALGPTVHHVDTGHGPNVQVLVRHRTLGSSAASTALAKRRWREPEKVAAAMRGLWVGFWEVLREEIREGGVHVEFGVRVRVWGLREWISRDGEWESKRARTAKRLKAVSWGSQRTASMYLYCRSLWIWGGSGRAVPVIAIV